MTNVQSGATSPHHILIVDDEETVLAGLRESLRREGYLVATAPNAVVALEILRQQSFSVIISDHRMPEMTGLEFLSQAKTIQPDATRILITGVLNLDMVIDAINTGEIYRFIVKPWLREELLATVNNAAQRYELICRGAALQRETQAMNEKLNQLNKSLEEQTAHTARQNEQLAKLNDAMRDNLRHSVQLCLNVMQTFYPILGSQARRVFEICKAMADSLELPSDQRQTLEISAWLHDIGLVGVPRHLIRRWQQEPENLSDAERALIEQHPVLGQELAAFMHHLEPVGVVIRAHHERFDGTGYPDRLRGEQIPWLGRLLAVAVSYAESNCSSQEILQVIELGSGRAHDPDAVRAFVRALPTAVVPRKEREVLLTELRPGMVLAKGIHTANGLLLVPEGQALSAPYIDKLLNHNRISPISQSLIVYC